MEILIVEILIYCLLRRGKIEDFQYRDLINKIENVPEIENMGFIVPKNDYHKEIYYFLTILYKKFDVDNLKLLHKNISSLKFKIANNKKLYNLLLPNSAAYYNCIKNNIVFKDKDSINDSIYHELFHMTSTLKTNKKVYCGFSQSTNSKLNNFGNGINEGYTDLLSNRYFNTEIMYNCEELIVSAVEAVIGKEVMEKLYLNANLSGLVKELNKYASKEDINDFINNVDIISSDQKDNLNLKELCAKKIIVFLYEIFCVKINKNNIDQKSFTYFLYFNNLEALFLMFKNYKIIPNKKEKIDYDKIKQLKNVKLVSFY